MNAVERTIKNWSKDYNQPAKLNQNQQLMVNVLAIVFLIMAVLQLASFDQFKEALSTMGLSSSPASWAVAVVVAEVWAAVGLLSVRMPGIVRGFGRLFSVLAAGFWFLLTVQAVSSIDASVANTGYFGKYMVQAPGWWVVIEVTALVFTTLYALEVTKRK